MKTVSLFVWGSCFKTWIIHNHLGNLRWNVPPPDDQVSKVSGSRSRKGHRSHKLCCQPPWLRSVWMLSLSRPHYQGVFLSQNMPHSKLSVGGTRGRGRTTESPGDPQQNLVPSMTNQRPEVRPGDQWEAETSEGPVQCQWPGVTQRLRQVPLWLRLSQLWSSDTSRHWELRAMSLVWIPELCPESNQDQYKICEPWQLSVVMYCDRQKPDK